MTVQTILAQVLTVTELAERYVRLDNAIRSQAKEMADEKKERRALKEKLMSALGDGGYLGDEQLTLKGFDGYESFGLSVVEREMPIRVESGDTEMRSALKVQRKRLRGGRRHRG